MRTPLGEMNIPDPTMLPTIIATARLMFIVLFSFTLSSMSALREVYYACSVN